ncbi:MAG: ribosome biogenesis GTPase YlqF [Peptostreptococcaceae bacterium]|nr:ribosome biogenesis GTPase YlqF [Peptostreptococcaceae bacterium]
MENINWYPGHMKKTRELIQENLKLVDLVIEVIDSRIPVSSRNPIIDSLIENKLRLIVLNKSDLSDRDENRKWGNRFINEGNKVITMNCMLGSNLDKLNKELQNTQNEKNEIRNMTKSLKLMIVGVPNVGKSSLINRMTGKKSTRTGDKPGVTRGKQWLTLKNGMQLLDTPGILWPKFEDPNVGMNLAFCGSIRDEILDTTDLAYELIKLLEVQYPKLLMERFKLDSISDDTLENMDAIALKRGFILPGKKIDYERTGRTLLDEFRSGKIGNITLEKIKDSE